MCERTTINSTERNAFGRRVTDTNVLARLMGLLGICCLMLTTACRTLSGDATAPPSNPAAEQQDLKDLEIDLLKRRLAEVQEKFDRENIARLVYETQLQVSAVRRLASHEPVRYAPMTQEVIDRMVEESITRSYTDRTLALNTWLYELFGVLPPGTDIVALIRDLLSEQAGGLYDPHTKTLYVHEEFPLETTTGRMILAHEINHAL